MGRRKAVQAHEHARKDARAQVRAVTAVQARLEFDPSLDERKLLRNADAAKLVKREILKARLKKRCGFPAAC